MSANLWQDFEWIPPGATAIYAFFAQAYLGGARVLDPLVGVCRDEITAREWEKIISKIPGGLVGCWEIVPYVNCQNDCTLGRKAYIILSGSDRSGDVLGVFDCNDCAMESLEIVHILRNKDRAISTPHEDTTAARIISMESETLHYHLLPQLVWV